jgi:hypothetical protein
MKPVNGAIEAYEKLTKHFDVYILSAASWNNPFAWTDKPFRERRVGVVRKESGRDASRVLYSSKPFKISEHTYIYP